MLRRWADRLSQHTSRRHHVRWPLFGTLRPYRERPGRTPTVDVGHLQVRDLGHPEARAVGDAERGLVLDARRGLEETRHLLLAQDDRRLARLGHGPQRTNKIGLFERHGEKEPQCSDGGVDRSWAGLLLRQVQLIAAKVLARRRIRRPTEEGCELPHIANVVPLRVFAEPARRDVVDQALTQRADGLLGHGKLLSRMGWNPTILRQGRAFSWVLTPAPSPLARRPYRASGLVLGRIFAVPGRCRRAGAVRNPTVRTVPCDRARRTTAREPKPDLPRRSSTAKVRPNATLPWRVGAFGGRMRRNPVEFLKWPTLQNVARAGVVGPRRSRQPELRDYHSIACRRQQRSDIRAREILRDFAGGCSRATLRKRRRPLLTPV